MTKKNIYLVGFMGAGKTTVGKKIALAEGITFIDLDAYIVQKNKMAISDIFHHFGEERFRELEKEALQEISNGMCVISTGGGIVENRENLFYMNQNGITIYLEASFETLYGRISGDEERPLTKAGFTGLYQRFLRRIPLYEQAKYTVQTENKPIEGIVREIQKLL